MERVLEHAEAKYIYNWMQKNKGATLEEFKDEFCHNVRPFEGKVILRPNYMLCEGDWG